MQDLDIANIPNFSELFAGDGPLQGDIHFFVEGLRRNDIYVDDRYTIFRWIVRSWLGSIPTVVFFAPLMAWCFWQLSYLLLAMRKVQFQR
jgi:hypothetical protein